MKRILIVNVNWLGDVLFSTPFIQALRKKFPNAHIACMVVPRCEEILESNPHLNEIIIYDEDGKHKGLFGKINFILSLRTKDFDTAILLHRSFTRTVITLLAGIPGRIGYITTKRFAFLTQGVKPPSNEVHRVDYYLNLLKLFGIDSPDRKYEFFISAKHRKKAKKLLENEGVKGSDILVVMNPGGNWDPKRWPRDNFARLGDRLAKRFEAKIAITGSRKDCALAEDIASQMSAKPIILCGKTSLKDLASVFERANLVVANDSGPMHIAISVGAKTIALFGPTLPEITGPIGKGKFTVIHKKTECQIPCYDMNCREYKCIESITVDDVMNEAGKML